jgi:hypothetical protein
MAKINFNITPTTPAVLPIIEKTTLSPQYRLPENPLDSFDSSKKQTEETPKEKAPQESIIPIIAGLGVLLVSGVSIYFLWKRANCLEGIQSKSPKRNPIPEPSPTEVAPFVRGLVSDKSIVSRIELLQANSTLPKDPFERAKEQLARRYEAIAKLSLEDRNAKNQEITTQSASDIRAQTNKYTVYLAFLKQVYNDLRLHPYKQHETIGFEETIGDYTKKNLNLPDGKVAHSRDLNDGWFRRYFINAVESPNPSKEGDRLSVNAVGCQALIDALDDVFLNQGVRGQYKTPNKTGGWHKRHDPITIYLGEEATPEVLEKISQAVKPYIRSSDPVLVGDVIMLGLALEKTPLKQDVKKFVLDMWEIDSDLSSALGDFLHYSSGTSSGQLKAAELMVAFLYPA